MWHDSVLTRDNFIEDKDECPQFGEDPQHEIGWLLEKQVLGPSEEGISKARSS